MELVGRRENGVPHFIGNGRRASPAVFFHFCKRKTVCRSERKADRVFSVTKSRRTIRGASEPEIPFSSTEYRGVSALRYGSGFGKTRSGRAAMEKTLGRRASEFMCVCKKSLSEFRGKVKGAAAPAAAPSRVRRWQRSPALCPSPGQAAPEFSAGRSRPDSGPCPPRCGALPRRW